MHRGPGGLARCGGPLRPDITLFGEALPVDAEWAARPPATSLRLMRELLDGGLGLRGNQSSGSADTQLTLLHCE